MSRNNDIIEGHRFPSKKYHRFIETISIRCQEEIFFSNIIEDRRVSLVRDYLNTEDSNAVIIKREKEPGVLGYVPKSLSKQIVPMMNEGTIFVGLIKNKASEAQLIHIDIYERIRVPCLEITRFRFRCSGSWIPCSYELDYSNTLLRYKENNLSEMGVDLDISFCPRTEHENAFIKPALHACNFLAWEDYSDVIINDVSSWSLEVWNHNKKIKHLDCDLYSPPEEWGLFHGFLFSILNLYCFPAHSLWSHQGFSCNPGDRFIEFRIRYNLTQHELAVILNVTVSRIEELENNYPNPDNGLLLMKLYEVENSIEICQQYRSIKQI